MVQHKTLSKYQDKSNLQDLEKPDVVNYNDIRKPTKATSGKLAAQLKV